MALKKKSGGGGGANWMDTYGDMVTLLLCFFVLLYSMSTISEENWKALVMSFNPSAVMELSEVDPVGNEGPISDPVEDGIGLDQGLSQTEIDAEIEQLYQMLQEYVAEQGAESNIAVTKGEGMVYISFGQAVFFDGNSSTLRQSAYPILDTVSDMLSQVAGAIDEVRVLGHTAQDKAQPNNVKNDRTLSSMRATNVVIYVQEHSAVDPARLISEGIGQWRPVGDNKTAEGRAQNRRVEMIISGRNLEQELMGQGGIQQYVTTESLTTD